MPKHGKQYRKAAEGVERGTLYSLEEAVNLLLANSCAKFDESVDVAVRLGIDPRHADQMVRSSVILPNGTGKDVRVLVFAKGEKEAEALAAGADYAGSEELVNKIKEGWLEFDKTIATPDMMGEVGKIGRVLG
ncbi:ribosomal protein L1, partial [Candidatus Electrothrix marina]